jgi:adenylate cyclase
MEAGSNTFLFADLAGFTALTEAHGDEHAADLVADFCREAGKLLPEFNAEQVKTLGDALMIRVAEPPAAVELGLQMVEGPGRRHGALPVRVGMHTGPAIERDGDWFGATVNLAARVAAGAAGSEVLLTKATRDQLPTPDSFELQARGQVQFKNVGDLVTLFAAVRPGSSELPVDPVCRMAVDPAHSAGSLLYAGRAYQFCSLECAHAFAENPGRYVESYGVSQCHTR